MITYTTNKHLCCIYCTELEMLCLNITKTHSTHTSQACQLHFNWSGRSGRLLWFEESNWHTGKPFLELSDAPMLFSRVWNAWKCTCRSSSTSVWKLCSCPQSRQQHSSTKTQTLFKGCSFNNYIGNNLIKKKDEKEESN